MVRDTSLVRASGYRAPMWEVVATGDSAARDYGRLIPMVECRNLTQLGEFVHDLA